MSFPSEDIEFQSINEDSSVQRLTNIKDDRLKTRILTYIRQNYMRVFWLMAIFIITLFILLMCFIYLYVQEVIFVQHLTPTAVRFQLTTEKIFTSMEIETTPVQDIAAPIESSTADEVILLPDEINLINRRPCSRVHCTPTSCNITGIGYEELRPYTCCDCISREVFLYKEFQYNVQTGKTTLIFQYLLADVRLLSTIDLMSIPSLPGLIGNWAVLQKSDTAWYLAYEDVALPDIDEDEDDGLVTQN